MSNILKVTTPVTGYDTPINKQNQRQTDDLSIKNPVAPDKVVRPDGKQGSGGNKKCARGFLMNPTLATSSRAFVMSLG